MSIWDNYLDKERTAIRSSFVVDNSKSITPNDASKHKVIEQIKMIG